MSDRLTVDRLAPEDYALINQITTAILSEFGTGHEAERAAMRVFNLLRASGRLK